MGRLHNIREALAARLDPIVDFTVYPLIPDSANVPCAWVEPDRPFVDYQDVFRGNTGTWRFRITIVTNRIDMESAQTALDEYLDPDGPFVAGLQADDIDDDLAKLTNNNVTVRSSSTYGNHEIGGTTYLGVQLFISLWA